MYDVPYALALLDALQEHGLELFRIHPKGAYFNIISLFLFGYVMEWEIKNTGSMEKERKERNDECR